MRMSVRIAFSVTLLLPGLACLVWKYYHQPRRNFDKDESVELRVSDLIIDDDKVHISACHNVTEPENNERWSVMREVVGVLRRLSAPYYLSEGSLLYLYRDCDLGQSDLDLVLDLAWWNKTNSQALQGELAAMGFTRTLVFGQLEEVGYEESYMRHDIKVDLFSATCKKYGAETKVCSVGLWIEGEHFQCQLALESIRVFSWWGGLNVNLPYPLPACLEEMYGPNYAHHLNNWRWDIDPFLTGYCLL